LLFGTKGKGKVFDRGKENKSEKRRLTQGQVNDQTAEKEKHCSYI